MKLAKSLLAGAAAALILYTAPAGFSQDRDPAPGDTVAIVNGEAITVTDIEREVIIAKQQLAQKGQEVPENAERQIEEAALDKLINRMLLRQEASKKGYQADAAEVERRIAKLRGQFPDEETYRATLAQFRHTPDSFRREVERGLLVQELIDAEIAPTVQVTEQDIQSFYDQNPRYFQQPERAHVRHILIAFSKDDGAEVRAAALRRIKEIQARLARGEDFAALARANSQDPSTRADGGDLGFIRQGQTEAPFEQAAFSLRPGEVSGVVETGFGFHLIQMIEHKPQGLVALSEVRDTIREYLKQTGTNEAVERHVQELRAVASIEKVLPRQTSQPEPALPAGPAPPVLSS